MTRAFPSGLVLCAAILLGAGCSRAPEFAGSPVVMISIDTLRADHLSCYGYRKLSTPNIDALARDGIRYENAYSQAPLTLPSHATLLTGLLPYEHGVRDNIGFRLSASTPTLTRRLKDAGYATGAAVSCYLLRRDRGLAAGFDFYDDQLGPADPDERAGEESARRLQAWMDSVSSRPVFTLLHLYEPHAPYAPPPPFAATYASNPYDGEIAGADAVVGRFVAYLKKHALYDRAVVVLVSDHGEGLNDHGEEEHGVFLYREAIRVPLIVKLPGSRQAGRIVSRPVGLCDVEPTVSALLGLRPSAAAGSSLLDPETGAGAARRIYSETLYPRLQLGWSDLASLTDARYQYIEAPRPELYDLNADPFERRDLAADKPAAFRSLRLALAGLTRPDAQPQASTPEELKRLASLGYLHLKGPPGAPASLPDPKDRIPALRRYKALLSLFHAGRDREAIALARELLAGDPLVLSAWRILSQSLARSGHLSEAVAALRSGISQAAGGVSPEEAGQAYEELAGLLSRRGDRPGAERLLREALGRGVASDRIRRELARHLAESGRAEEALAILPAVTQDIETLTTRGVVLAQTGRLQEARDAFSRALAADPNDARVLVQLANLSLREKNASAAKTWAQKALQADPRAASAWSALGAAQVQLGEEREALESWSRAVAEDPAQYDSLFNLAVLKGRMGRVEEARQALERFLASAPADRYGARRADAKALLTGLRRPRSDRSGRDSRR